MKKRKNFLDNSPPKWLTTGLFLGTAATVLYFESKRPLRRQTQPKMERDIRNLGMAAMSAAAISMVEKPVVDRLTGLVHKRKWGLMKTKRFPRWFEVAGSVILLDYTLYLWHVLTHKVPFLWKFHRVHHADLDMDASTAVRFHFMEMLFSVPWRALQILTIGASRFSVELWQSLTLSAILFHHSNTRLPFKFEKWLSKIFMTPRMHGIHHSQYKDESDSNWSTIFSLPDYLHRTARHDIPQDKITVGISPFKRPEELTIGKLLKLPLRAK